MKINSLLVLCSIHFAFLAGCSEPPQAPEDSVQMSTTAEGAIAFDPVPVAEAAPVVEIQRVDISDDQAIVKAAGVPVIKTFDSTDSKDEPKKIYKFNHEYVGAQVELSRTQITIGWTVASDSELVRQMTPKNIETVRNIAIAVLGVEGGQAIDNAMAGNGLKAGKIDGHTVWVTPCKNTSSCMMQIMDR